MIIIIEPGDETELNFGCLYTPPQSTSHASTVYDGDVHNGIIFLFVVVVVVQSTKFGLHRKVYQVTRINN